MNMNPTPLQRNYLETLAALRGKRLTVWFALTRRPITLLPWLFILILSAAAYWVVDEHVGFFLFGMFFGSILRVIAQCRFSVLAWPMTEHVVDWMKVEELRRGNEIAEQVVPPNGP
jgi:hypothetical protein